jgi:hypothetical protein
VTEFNPEPLPGERHPQGRRCRDPLLLMCALLLTLFYAVPRMAFDHLTSTAKSPLCPQCNGLGKVLVNGEYVKCGLCGGSGLAS